MDKQVLPNFLIVGAAKGGTTSLYYYLQQHPDVFLSAVKEPCFFCYAENKPPYKIAKNSVFTWPEYESLFAGSEKYKARGEATAIYLYMYDVAIHNIKKFLPDSENTKIIMILRNPVDRAYSQYMMNVRDLREPLSFEEAIKSEGKRKKEQILNTDFLYLERGLYYNQVKAYLENFKNVKIYLFEELISQPHELIKDLCEFLEIDPAYKFMMEDKFNTSGRPKLKLINKIIIADSVFKRLFIKILPVTKRQMIFEWIKNKVYSINLKKEKLNPDTKKMLKQYFKDDLLKLQPIVGKNISSWIN